MSRKKDIKIKKLKKIRLWPSVIGSLLVMLLFIFIIFAFCSVYVASIATIRFTEVTTQSENAVKYLTSEGPLGPEERFETISRLMPEISGLLFFDEEMNTKMSYGTGKIDAHDFYLLEGINAGGKAAFVYVPEKLRDIVSVDEDAAINIEVDKIIRLQMTEKYKLPEFGRNSWTKDEVYGFDMAFVYPDGESDGYVGVVSRFRLNYDDCLMALVAMIIVGILFVILLIYHMFSTLRLIADKRRAYTALYTDVVTGGRNSTFFFKRADDILRRNRNRKNYAIVQLRLEKYKGLVSCYGVEWAENLCEAMYSDFKKLVGKKEGYSRVENADFAFLLQYVDEKELNQRVRNIITTITDKHAMQKLYFNAGICKGNMDEGSKNLYNNASIARSTVRDENANEIKWFTENLAEAQRWERKVEDEMERAMAEGQFEMYLQPKYTTGNEVVGGAEALVRWNHPTEGLVPPGKFIPIFEKDGFILSLDDFMIGELAKHQAKWISEGKKVFPISVNVSRAHFMMDDLAEHIRDIVDKYNVPHEVIELELTESAFFDDKNTLINIVKKMREYGFPVSMDDFGAGYSSLNSLKEIPLDVVKLDADFFRGEGNDERGKIIISETIDLAKNLGMHIVAEGIETREQVDFLKDRKCDLIQGYYFAKPMKVSEFETRAFG